MIRIMKKIQIIAHKAKRKMTCEKKQCDNCQECLRVFEEILDAELGKIKRPRPNFELIKECS